MARHSRIPMTVIRMRSRSGLGGNFSRVGRMLYQFPQVVLLSQNVTKTKIVQVLRNHVDLISSLLITRECGELVILKTKF